MTMTTNKAIQLAGASRALAIKHCRLLGDSYLQGRGMPIKNTTKLIKAMQSGAAPPDASALLAVMMALKSAHTPFILSIPMLVQRGWQAAFAGNDMDPETVNESYPDIQKTQALVNVALDELAQAEKLMEAEKAKKVETNGSEGDKTKGNQDQEQSTVEPSESQSV